MPSFSYVQGTGAAGNGVASLSATYPGSVTAGNLLVVSFCLGGSLSATVTDSAGNTYTQAVTAGFGSGGQQLFLYYARANTTGSGVAVTVTPSASAGFTIAIDEYSAGGGTWAIDGTATGSDGGTLGTSLSTASITPAGTDLIVACGRLQQNHTTLTYPWSAGSGFTLTYNQSGNSTYADFAAEYALNVTAVTTPSMSATAGNATNWGMVAAAFKATSGTSEGFDSSGSLPAGVSSPDAIWTVVGTTDGVSPTSAPHMLQGSPLTTPSFLTWATSDGNSGNVTAYVNVNPDAAQAGGNPPTVGIAVRVSGTGDAPSCCLARINLNTGVTAIAQWSSGSESVLATNSPVAGPSGWITLAFTASGTALSLAIQQISTGLWMTPAGSFTSASRVNYLTATTTLTGAGYWSLYCRAPATGPDAFFDDLWIGPAGSSPSTTTVLYGADLGPWAGASLATSARSDAGQPSDAWWRASLAGDVESGSESTLAWAGDVESGLSSSSGLSGRAVVDAASATATSSLTTYAGGYVYGSDAGTEASATLRWRLVADLSTDAESFASSMVVTGADGGVPDDSVALTRVTTTAAYQTIDGVSATESAPAPTAWDIDAIRWSAAWLSIGRGAGESGAGSGLTDAGTADERWFATATIRVADAGFPAEQSWAATLLTGLDAATSSSLAAIGLVTDGYHIYCSPTSGGPIDYSTVVATNLGFLDTTWTSGTYGPGTWTFGVRAFDAVGEEQNIDCVVTVVLDQYGRDITSIPPPPAGLRGFALKGGAIRVEWGYLAGLLSGRTPTGFNVYCTAGAAVSYDVPAATVAYRSGLFGAFSATIAGLQDEQVYRVAVRAINASGEEQNGVTIAVTAEATGPSRPVAMLTGTRTT